MNNNSDPLFDRYAELDFSNAKPVAEIPVLAKLQAEHGGKSPSLCGRKRGFTQRRKGAT